MSLPYYRGLLSQTGRIESFRQAIRSVVRAGDCVLDVGAGLGTFAFFAAQAGARRVWAVDGDPIIHVARTLAVLNGLNDRVETVRGWLPDLTLPERADVVLFEDFPARGVDARVFTLLRALHERFTVAAPRSVPARARFWLAPVRASALEATLSPFGPEDCAFGLRWSASRWYLEQTPLGVVLPGGALAAPGQSISELWFDRPPEVTGLAGRAEWTLPAAEEVAGLALWFDLELAPGTWVTNAPGAASASWGSLCLPLAPRLTVGAGGTLRAFAGPETLPDGVPGWLRWEAAVGPEVVRGHEFRGVPASLGDLLARSPDGVPALSPEGRLELLVLSLTDGRRSVRQIAAGVRGAYPEMSEAEAIRLVTRVLAGRAAGRLPRAAAEVGP